MTTKPVLGSNLSNGYVVGQTEWNRDVVQQGNWAQEVLLGTNTDKIPLVALPSAMLGYSPNLLVNPGYEVWQRGAGAFTATGGGAFTADRWRATFTGSSSMTVARSATTVYFGSQYSLQVAYTHAAGGIGQVYQDIEIPQNLRGQTLTFSVWVFSNAGTVYAQIYDGASTNSTVLSGFGTWQQLVVTRTVSNAATLVRVSVVFSGATQVSYVDNAILSPGSATPVYVPLSYGDDLYRCQRHYQKVRTSGQWQSAFAGQARSFGFVLPVPMAADPTTATITAGSRANITSVLVFPGTSAYCNAQSLVVVITATATATSTYSLDDVVALEAVV